MDAIVMLVGLFCLMAIGWLGGMEYVRGSGCRYGPPGPIPPPEPWPIAPGSFPPAPAVPAPPPAAESAHRQGVLDERARCVAIADADERRWREVAARVLTQTDSLAALNGTDACEKIARLIADADHDPRPAPTLDEPAADPVKAERERCAKLLEVEAVVRHSRSDPTEPTSSRFVSGHLRAECIRLAGLIREGSEP